VHILPISTLGMAAAMLAFADHGAQALTPDHSLSASPPVENVACRVVRERVVRPFGPPVFREREVCAAPSAPVVAAQGCEFRSERIVRPDGSVVFRKVRRCL
jgi:hypothetical protein